MWDPLKYVPSDRGYIEVYDDRYYVMRDDRTAFNWRELEPEAKQESLSSPWHKENNPYYYPLSWDLMAKAKFLPREEDLPKETYIVGDNQWRFFVRHLED